ICIWSGTPILLLLPVSIILIRLLHVSPGFIWFAIILLFVILLWVLLRMMRAAGIVFDITPLRSYVVGLSFFGLIGAAIIFLFQYQFSTLQFLDYFFRTVI
ncbi:MAG: hypothetical protein WCT77_02610, partial [Bacteroidota bacterium]